MESFHNRGLVHNKLARCYDEAGVSPTLQDAESYCRSLHASPHSQWWLQRCNEWGRQFPCQLDDNWSRRHWWHYVYGKSSYWSLCWWHIFYRNSLSLQVSADTTGWIGIGFSPNGAMTDADMIVAWFADGQMHMKVLLLGESTPHESLYCYIDICLVHILCASNICLSLNLSNIIRPTLLRHLF